ncbi:MAG TPA: hypothetical protein VGB09_04100 [Candidatus Binatia bacterium]
MNPVDLFRFSYSTADARSLLLLLLSVDLLLAFAYILTHVIAPESSLGPLKNFLDVDREVSIPTWFSSIQLFAVGAVLLMQARGAKQLKVFLVLAGLGFMFLSLDEAAAIHDNIYRSAQRLKLPWIGGEEYLVWMVAYLGIGIIGLLIGYRPALFVWLNFRREALWVAAGGAIFVAAGIGIEILTHYLVRRAVDAKFFLAVAAEEFFEMAGVSIMLYGFMLLGIRLESEPSKEMPRQAKRLARLE